MKYADLVPLKNCESLSKNALWTFDTETRDGLKGKELYCWSLASIKGGKGRDTKIYNGKTMDSFFKILVKLNDEKRKQLIFVHNLGFDIRFVIDYCLRHNLSYKSIEVGSHTILCYLSDLNYKFIDSFQFLLCSQEKAEIVYEVPKELTKIDCNDLFKQDFKTWTDLDKKRLIEHNKNDVLALQFILNKFRKQMFEIANVDLLQCNSLAGLSLKAFRKSISSKIVNPYLNSVFDKDTQKYHYELQDEKYQFAKKSYYGGRTECFNHALVKNVNYFDTVSMFPSQMMFMEYPDGIPIWEKDSRKIAESLTDKLSIIEAKMIPNYNEKYPILPFRKDNKTIFGNFNEIGIWTSVEINYALERGYQFEFIRALIFPSKFNPFKPFVSKFFELKQKSKGSIRQQAKIVLNSCYGKFGQRIELSNVVPKFFKEESEARDFYEQKIDNDEKANFEFNEIYQLFLVKYTEITKRIKPFQIVHLSSFITSYARVQLIKAIHLLTDNNITVYYCDTDSIVAENNPILKLGKELGNWDIECKFTEFRCIAPKCYIAKMIKDEKEELVIKVKGIRKDKIESWMKKHTEISQILIELEKKIEIDEQYLPIKSSLLRNKTVLSSAKTIKKLALNDVKRKVLANYDTEPLRD